MKSWKQKMINQGGMEPRERLKTTMTKTTMMTTMTSRTRPWTTCPSTWPDWSAILATKSSPSRATLTGPLQRSNAWLTKLLTRFDDNFQVHKRSENRSWIQIWHCWEVGKRRDRFGAKIDKQLAKHILQPNSGGGKVWRPPKFCWQWRCSRAHASHKVRTPSVWWMSSFHHIVFI